MTVSQVRFIEFMLWSKLDEIIALQQQQQKKKKKQLTASILVNEIQNKHLHSYCNF